MHGTLRAPEEIVPYRTLGQMLAFKAGGVPAVRPDDTARSALETMASKDVGFLVVLEGDHLVGVLSERDYTRKLIPSGRTPQEARVADLMTRDVITVTLAHGFRDCVILMDKHGTRHLPVVDGESVVGVISVRDLLREAVLHDEKVVRQLELERLTIFTSTA